MFLICAILSILTLILYVRQITSLNAKWYNWVITIIIAAMTIVFVWGTIAGIVK